MEQVRTNYSRGYVVEFVQNDRRSCESWLLLPAENLWNTGVRGFLYLLAMLYLFLGIAIISDVFMCAIEVITSKKRTVVRYDPETQQKVSKDVLVWNETVANLTLMALGSSAPEILLAVMETVTNLGKDTNEDGLGTFTIIGSAAFNLLIITAVCIMSVPLPEVKKVREFGVFILTSIWSIFAYLWLLIVLLGPDSPGEVSIWEAWVTFSFFPIMVLMAYCQDNGWWCRKRTAVGVDSGSHVNVRVLTENRRGSIIHGMARELTALEKEKHIRNSRTSLRTINEKDQELGKDEDGGSTGSEVKLVRAEEHSTSTAIKARARFRHAAVRSMMGGHKPKQLKPPPSSQAAKDKLKMSDVVSAAKDKDSNGIEDLLGKFTFASPSYAVLESAGILEIEVLFHRSRPAPQSITNGGTNLPSNGMKHKETSFTNNKFVHSGIVAVEYETREGSGKIDKDFKYSQGHLVFKETEYSKKISIPIINDNQYDADVDFYVILKNPSGDAGLSDPSVTRVTIIDDDEPGEFQFEEPQYYADLKAGNLVAKVTRQHGCDGTVTLEYSTIDGTAKGGDKLTTGIDYKNSAGTLEFKHGESSKSIAIDVNKDCQGSKNFIITLRNPSLGAKIGDHSAAVANITKDDLDARLAGLLDENEEEVTWSGQFKGAMALESERDEEGNDIPLRWYDYLLHFLTFFWKVLFAFVPPRRYLGAWPAFFISLGCIGLLTSLIEQLGDLLGCVLHIEPSVAGITIVALGTSLPDLFASRTAALHDEGADAAIGNVTGSNSVNVFLGLGLPWVISAMYAYFNNKKFTVNTDSLVAGVVIFTIAGTMCIFLLIFRRRVVGGELGGSHKAGKILSSLFLVSLWLIYLTLSTIKAYSKDSLPW